MQLEADRKKQEEEKKKAEKDHAWFRIMMMLGMGGDGKRTAG